ncbi:hypothetical protein [uncultured Mobiluncus sp.]|uniref:hypothetical protein n=1 Tax=uncultured Mobiluncus sp. TaxID=293425 RepID=UPI002609E206|nr:hypothetical protein [uncultured Mobiluncus sp.]
MVNNAWESLEARDENPRPGILKLAQKQKDRKRILNYVRAATYSWPILIVVTIFSLAYVISGAAVPQTGTGNANGAITGSEDALDRSLALETVQEWLSTSPSPLPRAKILAWNNAIDIPQISEPKETDSNGDVVPWPVYRMHSVSIAQFPPPDGDSTVVRFFTATVAIARAASGPLVVGEPSLVPAPTPPAGVTLEQLWPGALPANLSDNAQVAVTNWAEAFTSGDGAKLRQIVGDPDETHNYVPLPGFDLVEAKIVAATYPPGTDLKANPKLEEAPETVIARVSLSGTWPDDEGGRVDGETGEGLPSISYDVLIVEASSAAPRVVAWSGAGGGLGLEPFQNWVTAEVAKANEDAGLVSPQDKAGAGPDTDADTDTDTDTEADTDTDTDTGEEVEGEEPDADTDTGRKDKKPRKNNKTQKPAPNRTKTQNNTDTNTDSKEA